MKTEWTDEEIRTMLTLPDGGAEGTEPLPDAFEARMDNLFASYRAKNEPKKSKRSLVSVRFVAAIAAVCMLIIVIGPGRVYAQAEYLLREIVWIFKTHTVIQWEAEGDAPAGKLRSLENFELEYIPEGFLIKQQEVGSQYFHTVLNNEKGEFIIFASGEASTSIVMMDSEEAVIEEYDCVGVRVREYLKNGERRAIWIIDDYYYRVSSNLDKTKFRELVEKTIDTVINYKEEMADRNREFDDFGMNSAIHKRSERNEIP